MKILSDMFGSIVSEIDKIPLIHSKEPHDPYSYLPRAGRWLFFGNCISICGLCLANVIAYQNIFYALLLGALICEVLITLFGLFHGRIIFILFCRNKDQISEQKWKVQFLAAKIITFGSCVSIVAEKLLSPHSQEIPPVMHLNWIAIPIAISGYYLVCNVVYVAGKAFRHEHSDSE